MAVNLPAQTLSADDDFFWFQVAQSNAITVSGAGTTVATVRIGEPNITISGGSVAVATSLVISAVPTDIRVLVVIVGDLPSDAISHRLAEPVRSGNPIPLPLQTLPRPRVGCCRSR